MLAGPRRPAREGGVKLARLPNLCTCRARLPGLLHAVWNLRLFQKVYSIGKVGRPITRAMSIDTRSVRINRLWPAAFSYLPLLRSEAAIFSRRQSLKTAIRHPRVARPA